MAAAASAFLRLRALMIRRIHAHTRMSAHPNELDRSSFPALGGFSPGNLIASCVAPTRWSTYVIGGARTGGSDLIPAGNLTGRSIIRLVISSLCFGLRFFDALD
jgi:hypothetical protein